ncbi:MAG: hypothetical protein JWO88_2912 [Frankiales bacterium]|nr:hypothetical protein [Frankiales bacterium]
MALTSDAAGGSRVELVRCTACGRNTWRLDGQDVDKGRALGALSAAFAPAVPRPPRRSAGPLTAATVPAAVTEPADPGPVNTGPSNGELAALLSGWHVLGGHG